MTKNILEPLVAITAILVSAALLVGSAVVVLHFVIKFW